MRKYFYLFTFFFLQAAITACTDSEIYDSPDNGSGSNVRIILNVPVENGKTRGLVYGSDEEPIEGESVIKDVYALAFSKSNGRYLGRLHSYLSAGSLIANIDVGQIGMDELTVVVLTNLSGLENGSELIYKINNLTPESGTKEQILKSLEYRFTEKWTLTERPLPMWGETDIQPVEEATVTGSINLYRSVSKINVVVNLGQGITDGDTGTDVFRLKSVRVYYARTSGLAGALHAPVTNPEGSPTITTPSVPPGVEYFPRYNGEAENNLLFMNVVPEGSYAIENRIYTPESNQKNSVEPMCLVVGGYYMGSAQETFYRVDFKQGNKGTEFYDAIRNHIYTFNINNVTRPGTDDPDPALDHVVVGMDVTIREWSAEWMQGIGGQYTLEVSTGGFVLAASNTSPTANRLQVNTTHNEAWSIESPSADWFTLEKTGTGIAITATNNEGGERRGTFIVKSGNLHKVITLRQRGKGTANSYIVNDDGNHIEQDLIVTVKGNGEIGLVADGITLEEKDPYIALEKIGDVQLIWETSDGLVSIVKGANGKAVLDEASGSIKYKVDLTKQNTHIVASNSLNAQNYRGGNALIGAFGKNTDGSVNYSDLLWTWHIWVCPDLDSNGDGYVSDSELSAKDQAWVTGYTFMDRNMGALSKNPGLPSLGLLYQWGRKDPFVGAAKVSTDQSNNRMYTHLPLQAQGYYWRNSSGNMSINEAVKAPTTLINGTITGVDYKSLWGTATGLAGEAHAGNKTIYDPCPHGYRVPNVAAVVFKSGNSSSETNNWYDNNRFWPYTTNSNSSDTWHQVLNMNSYGCWLRYDSNDSREGLVTYQTWKNYGSSWRPNWKGDITDPSNTANIGKVGFTWLPLSGIYEGNINSFSNLDGENSLLVNSIMWTNSSVKITNALERPAAMFLHGIEAGNNGSRNGNHIHKLKENQNALYAKPQHAGAVRCVRDIKVQIGEENAIKLPGTITLGRNEGNTQTAELTSLMDSWEVVDPGAIWFVMTPDTGPVGSKQALTFRATQTNTTGSVRSAQLKIRFNDTAGTTRTIVVTQAK